MASTQLSLWVGKPAEKPQLPFESATSRPVPSAMNAHPQTAPWAVRLTPGAQGFPPDLRHPSRYIPAGLCSCHQSARRMTKTSYNLQILLMLLLFSAVPAFLSSHIIFPLHRLRLVEPLTLEEEPYSRKAPKIADYNPFRKQASGAVRFPRSVMATLKTMENLIRRRRLSEVDGSDQAPTQISRFLWC